MARIIIFASGEAPPPHLVTSCLRPGDYIICADGGANHARDAGIRPDLIVGDMDSITPENLSDFEGKGVAVERFPTAKDETDLEIALRRAISRAPLEELVVLGALGGRLDHLLANILLFTRADLLGLTVHFPGEVVSAWVLNAPGRVEVHGATGDTLSLIPLSPTVEGVAAHDVIWPMAGATLTQGGGRTVSNRMCAPVCAITAERGSLLITRLCP